MAVRIELVEGADASAALLIAAGVIEFKVHPRCELLDRYVCFLAERNHYVGEAVQKVSLIVKSGAVAACEISVHRERAPPLGIDAEIWRDMEVGIQTKPREEIDIGAFGGGRAELKLIKVFHALADLPKPATLESAPRLLRRRAVFSSPGRSFSD